MEYFLKNNPKNEELTTLKRLKDTALQKLQKEYRDVCIEIFLTIKNRIPALILSFPVHLDFRTAFLFHSRRRYRIMYEHGRYGSREGRTSTRRWWVYCTLGGSVRGCVSGIRGVYFLVREYVSQLTIILGNTIRSVVRDHWLKRDHDCY